MGLLASVKEELIIRLGLWLASGSEVFGSLYGFITSRRLHQMDTSMARGVQLGAEQEAVAEGVAGITAPLESGFH